MPHNQSLTWRQRSKLNYVCVVERLSTREWWKQSSGIVSSLKLMKFSIFLPTPQVVNLWKRNLLNFHPVCEWKSEPRIRRILEENQFSFIGFMHRKTLTYTRIIVFHLPFPVIEFPSYAANESKARSGNWRGERAKDINFHSEMSHSRLLSLLLGCVFRGEPHWVRFVKGKCAIKVRSDGCCVSEMKLEAWVRNARLLSAWPRGY